jgi:fructose/tagatose bisphosphate aldolase
MQAPLMEHLASSSDAESKLEIGSASSSAGASSGGADKDAAEFVTVYIPRTPMPIVMHTDAGGAFGVFA